MRLRRRRNEGEKALVRWHEEEEEGKREKIKLREKGERPEKANIVCKQIFNRVASYYVSVSPSLFLEESKLTPPQGHACRGSPSYYVRRPCPPSE